MEDDSVQQWPYYKLDPEETDWEMDLSKRVYEDTSSSGIAGEVNKWEGEEVSCDSAPKWFNGAGDCIFNTDSLQVCPKMWERVQDFVALH